jgi:hypothetical protein
MPTNQIIRVALSVGHMLEQVPIVLYIDYKLLQKVHQCPEVVSLIMPWSSVKIPIFRVARRPRKQKFHDNKIQPLSSPISTLTKNIITGGGLGVSWRTRFGEDFISRGAGAVEGSHTARRWEKSVCCLPLRLRLRCDATRRV